MGNVACGDLWPTSVKVWWLPVLGSPPAPPLRGLASVLAAVARTDPEVASMAGAPGRERFP
jgi:hypothetical protein